MTRQRDRERASSFNSDGSLDWVSDLYLLSEQITLVEKEHNVGFLEVVAVDDLPADRRYEHMGAIRYRHERSARRQGVSVGQSACRGSNVVMIPLDNTTR